MIEIWTAFWFVGFLTWFAGVIQLAVLNGREKPSDSSYIFMGGFLVLLGIAAIPLGMVWLGNLLI